VFSCLGLLSYIESYIFMCRLVLFFSIMIIFGI